MQCGRWETHVLAGTRVNWCARPSMLNNYVNWYLHLWHTVTRILPSFRPSSLLCNLNITLKQPSTWHTQGHQVEDDTVHPSLSCFGAYYYYCMNSSVSLQPSLQPRVSKPSNLTQKWLCLLNYESTRMIFCVNKLRVPPYDNITCLNT